MALKIKFLKPSDKQRMTLAIAITSLFFLCELGGR